MKFYFAFLFAASLSSTLEARQIEALYSVPVEDPSIIKYAKFPTKAEFTELSSDPYEIKFRLPEDLVGINGQLYVLRKQRDSFWSGPNVEAICTEQMPQQRINCDARFFSLRVDIEEIEKFLKIKYPAEEFDARLEISRQFVSDPHGFLLYSVGSP